MRDSPIPSSAGFLASVIGEIAAQVEYILVDEFSKRGYDPKLASLYSRALVGMVALVGSWWIDVGKPPKEQVAAHLVNLAWNGLSDLDARPELKSAS